MNKAHDIPEAAPGTNKKTTPSAPPPPSGGAGSRLSFEETRLTNAAQLAVSVVSCFVYVWAILFSVSVSGRMEGTWLSLMRDFVFSKLTSWSGMITLTFFVFSLFPSLRDTWISRMVLMPNLLSLVWLTVAGVVPFVALMSDSFFESTFGMNGKILCGEIMLLDTGLHVLPLFIFFSTVAAHRSMWLRWAHQHAESTTRFVDYFTEFIASNVRRRGFAIVAEENGGDSPEKDMTYILEKMSESAAASAASAGVKKEDRDALYFFGTPATIASALLSASADAVKWLKAALWLFVLLIRLFPVALLYGSMVDAPVEYGFVATYSSPVGRIIYTSMIAPYWAALFLLILMTLWVIMGWEEFTEQVAKRVLGGSLPASEAILRLLRRSTLVALSWMCAASFAYGAYVEALSLWDIFTRYTYWCMAAVGASCAYLAWADFRAHIIAPQITNAAPSYSPSKTLFVDDPILKTIVAPFFFGAAWMAFVGHRFIVMALNATEYRTVFLNQGAISKATFISCRQYTLVDRALHVYGAVAALAVFALYQRELSYWFRRMLLDYYPNAFSLKLRSAGDASWASVASMAAASLHGMSFFFLYTLIAYGVIFVNDDGKFHGYQYGLSTVNAALVAFYTIAATLAWQLLLAMWLLDEGSYARLVVGPFVQWSHRLAWEYTLGPARRWAWRRRKVEA